MERNREDIQEKAHRQLSELLQELRVAQQGVQVLFAFLLTVPFTQGWTRVTAFQKDLYYVCLLSAAAATAFLIAPSAIHRLDFDRGDKPLIVRVSNALAIVGLTSVGISMVGVVCLITDVIYGGTPVVGYTVGTAALFLILWYAIPIVVRMRGGRNAA